MPEPSSPNLTRLVTEALDHDVLARICTMREAEFADAYKMTTVDDLDKDPDVGFFNFKDNGSDILAVAHLDTVGAWFEREARFLDTEGGPVVYSRALDDRLGAYIILELLPKLGINYDILLTVGEETGQSTAQHFWPDKDYNWMIEFDRGGTDVVMYQYEDDETIDLVRACGARVGDGIFSDISYMEHLEVKGFNWGVGYQDYHGPRAHAYLDDTTKMVGHYLKFHESNAGIYLPHDEREQRSWWGGYSDRSRWSTGTRAWLDDDDLDPLDADLLEDEESDHPDETKMECFRLFGDHHHDYDGCQHVLRELGEA